MIYEFQYNNFGDLGNGSGNFSSRLNLRSTTAKRLMLPGDAEPG